MIKALSSPDPVLANAKRWWQQPLWWMQRLKLIFIFAIKLHSKKMLKLLIMLFIALCPMLGLESISEFFASRANEAAHTFAALGLTLWVTGFGFYFLKELHKIIATPLAKEFLTYLSLPEYGEHLGSIPVMRKQIETLCNVRLKTGTSKAKRLLFVVDDLDRCGPQGIVKIFEAVRLVLDIENVMVIIAVDQRIALAAMALHYKDLAAHHQLENSRAIARDYLAKVIHLPIILKSPQKTDIQRYLNHIWDASVSAEHKQRITDFLKPKSLEDTAQNPEPIHGENIDNKNRKEIDLSADKKNLSTKEILPNTTPPDTEIKIEEPKTDPVASLSESQKEAFVFWLDYFGLLNPRQVKRLNNCYNILRSYYYDDIERSMTPSETETLKDAKNFPIMIALFIMEYLNSLESPDTRTKLKKQLQYSLKEKIKETVDDKKLTADIIQLVQDASLTLKIDLIEAVEPFVLPAIEKTFSTKS
jgi:hypothetical protein